MIRLNGCTVIRYFTPYRITRHQPIHTQGDGTEGRSNLYRLAFKYGRTMAQSQHDGTLKRCDSDERDPGYHLCCGVGFSRDHLIFRRRNVDNAREYEESMSGPDCSDRHLVGDWSASWLCSATGITCRTNSTKLTKQSKHHPVMKRLVRPGRSSHLRTRPS